MGKDQLDQAINNRQDDKSQRAVQVLTAKYKKVFIQRDYSQGTGVRFQTSFPPDLEGYIDLESFSHLVTNVNKIYGEGESMSFRTFIESFCACLSAYSLYLCIQPYYNKCINRARDFIQEQNDLRWKRRGLLVTDPMDRGLRVIEITIFLEKAEEGITSDS